jgi:hypothetical protein
MLNIEYWKYWPPSYAEYWRTRWPIYESDAKSDAEPDVESDGESHGHDAKKGQEAKERCSVHATGYV